MLSNRSVLGKPTRIEQMPYPPQAIRAGQENGNCLCAEGHGWTLVVMYCVESYLENGRRRRGIHVSLSFCRDGVRSHVTEHVIEVARYIVHSRGLTFPVSFEETKFEAGDFAGFGVHLWEK